MGDKTNRLMDVRREGVGEGDNYMTEDHKVRSVRTLRRPYLTRETNGPRRWTYDGELHGMFFLSFFLLMSFFFFTSMF